MSERLFQALLAELFDVAGVTQAKASAGVGQCRCAGVDLVLHYDERIDPSNVHAYVDFGIIPPARQHDIFRTLLSRNLRFGCDHRAVIGLDGDADRIVLVARIALDDTPSGRAMADTLMRMIRQVQAWCSPRPPVRMWMGRPRAGRRLC